MKRIPYILLFFAMTIIGCSKDDEGDITIEDDGFFIDSYGGTLYIPFTSSNIAEYEVTKYPDGWDVTVDASEKMIVAVAPSEDDSTAELAGMIYVTGTTPDDDYAYASATVGMSKYVELDDPNNDQQANCMIVTEPNVVYSFNPNRRGEETTEVSEKAVDCKIVWRTINKPIYFVQMTDDGRIQFYTYPDFDEDNILTEGNVVIAALDKSDNILWSWHIWVTDDPVTEINAAGMTFLDRNLGAYTNDNSSEDDILTSYGLYYQWGRKDPFIYPETYNASGSVDADVYDEDGYISMKSSYVTSNIGYGTVLYTILNPEIYVVGDEDTAGDWLYAGNEDNTLWVSGQKTIYDPSPKGYRVPTSAEYELLTLDDSEYLELESYGRTLSGNLFMALGYRTYLDYSIQNYMDDGSYSRWAGYYWASDSQGDESEALYFDYSGTKGIKSLPRATGMQIRPIKME